jgi:hypothetical protein
MNQGAFWSGGRPGENGTRNLYQMTHDDFTRTKDQWDCLGQSNQQWRFVPVR